ncbi:DNA-binding protein [Clavibacter cf. michiganensis LMG 26808]|nr:DNA-binding protein [Clavibacter cf. michiganensis LMG 26808]
MHGGRLVRHRATCGGRRSGDRPGSPRASSSQPARGRRGRARGGRGARPTRDRRRRLAGRGA